MRIAGIIAEYNPFHNGHRFHAEKTRSLSGADAVLAIMSGSFVQRGMPASYSKWDRAACAVKNGADLVLELPAYYAVSPADIFAYGAVKTLELLGGIDSLCFGAENPDFKLLCRIASVGEREPEEVSEQIKGFLNMGYGYPAARAKAISAHLCIDEKILSQPNNMLAIEYIKWLIRLGSSISPILIGREKAAYHNLDTHGEFASAAAVRDMIKREENIKEFVPAETYELSKRERAVSNADFDCAVLSVLRRMKKEELKNIRGSVEGIENRVKDCAQKCESIDALCDAASTKRYTRSRMARFVCNAFLGIEKRSVPLVPTYARVLAFNNTGREAIAALKETTEIPIITKAADFKADELFKTDVTATDLYSLAQWDKRGGKDFTTSPIYINE